MEVDFNPETHIFNKDSYITLRLYNEDFLKTLEWNELINSKILKKNKRYNEIMKLMKIYEEKFSIHEMFFLDLKCLEESVNRKFSVKV